MQEHSCLDWEAMCVELESHVKGQMEGGGQKTANRQTGRITCGSIRNVSGAEGDKDEAAKSSLSGGRGQT